MDYAKVLVVEDDEAFIPLIKLALRELDLEVTVMKAGNSALEEISNSNYDLVITDYRLPEVHGMEILKAALKRNAECKTILISAADISMDSQTRRDLNLLGYLQKPMSPIDLRKLVMSAFSPSSLQ